MALINIPTDHLRHTRFAQDWMAEGEARGPLSEASTARIQALPLKQLELLADALLDFGGPADLAAWLEEHKG